MGMPLRLGEASAPLTPVSDPCHSHSCKAAASGRGAEWAVHVRGLVGSDTSSSHPHPPTQGGRGTRHLFPSLP